MRKRSKILVTLLLSISMLAGLVPTLGVTASAAYDPDDLTAGMVGSTEHVDQLTIAGHTAFMYVPTSNRVGNFLCLTPMVVVLGDGAFTKETVLEAAHTKGFGTVAESRGVCILFLNPIESWDSQADADSIDALYAGIFDVYSSDPTVVFKNGVGTYHDRTTDKDRTVYPGALHGFQVFAEGKGADYAAKNFTTLHTYNANYSVQWFAGLPGNASALALFCPSTLEENPDGDVIPMAVVNGPANSQAVVDSYNGTLGVSKVVNRPGVTGFEADLVVDLYNSVLDRLYYSQGQLREFPNYAARGIVEINETKTLASGKAVEFYMYVPDDIDFATEDSTPLVMWFHGGGGEAEAMVAWTGWPMVGKENGFVVLSVDQHSNYTSHEIIELLDMLLVEYPFLDASRVYAGGFSMGGGMTWNLAMKHWDRLAGVIPTAAGGMAERGDEKTYDDYCVPGAIIPVFYVAGGVSFLAETPTQEGNNVNQIFTSLWRMNDLGEYSFDPNSGSRWGQAPSALLKLPYTDGEDLLKPTAEERAVNVFQSLDGNVYTYLVINKNRSHTITQGDAEMAWSYLKQFSRNPDGTIAINGKTPKAPWYAPAVRTVLSKGLVAGAPNGTYTAGNKVTRAALIQMLYNLAGKPQAKAVAFTDVTQGSWYADAAAWAAEKGLVKAGGAFGPGEVLTREDIASLLYSYAKLEGKSLPAEWTYDLTAADAGEVSQSAREAVYWCVENGIIQGRTTGRLSPTQVSTCAEAIQMVARLLSL